MAKDAVYLIDYFLTYCDAQDGKIMRAYVKAPDGLECKRGELEKICQAKIHENLKIDRWEKLNII